MSGDLGAEVVVRAAAATLQKYENIELLLRFGMAHGDLSAYNILYWDSTITLIDFPQVVELSTNTQAYDILARDIERVCQYFAKQGAAYDAQPILDKLWQRYGSYADRLAIYAPYAAPDSMWRDIIARLHALAAEAQA